MADDLAHPVSAVPERIIGSLTWVPTDMLPALLAGFLSVLTPEALMLFPLCFVAAGAADLAGVIAIPIGVGVSQILPVHPSTLLGSEAGLGEMTTRQIACLLLMADGICLTNQSLAQRFALITGGLQTVGSTPAGRPGLGGMFRNAVLAMLVGVIWIPDICPVLERAAVMAVNTATAQQAAGVRMAFGLAAAVPWIVLGRILHALSNPGADLATDGMASKRTLGFLLLMVAGAGLSGIDRDLVNFLLPFWPPWACQLALAY